MKQKNIKQKIMSALFAVTFTASMFQGFVFNKQVEVLAATTPYDGAYSSLSVLTKSNVGPSQQVDYTSYNQSSVFPSTVKYSDASYFGEIGYSTSSWVHSQSGIIASQAISNHAVTKTTTAKTSLLLNGSFNIRKDGAAADWFGSGNGWLYLAGAVPNGIGIVPTTADQYQLWGSQFVITAGTTYTVEWDWFQESNSKGAYCWYIFRNASGTVLSQGPLVDKNFVNGVISESAVIDAPASATTMQIVYVSKGAGGAGANATWVINAVVVSGNVRSEMDGLFSATVPYTSGDLSGNLSKVANGLSWTRNAYGKTGRRSPVINDTYNATIVNQLINVSGNQALSLAQPATYHVPGSKTVSFYDPEVGITKSGSISYVSETASYGTRTYTQLNGTGGFAGYAATNSTGATLQGAVVTWTSTYPYAYRGYEQRGYSSDFNEANVITRYGATNLASYGGASSAAQLGWYGGSSTTYNTAATNNQTYSYSNAPRLNNDTGYVGYAAVFDGLKNSLRSGSISYTALNYGNYASVKSRAADGTIPNISSWGIPFIASSGSETDIQETVDTSMKSYVEDKAEVFDYGFVTTYNGWLGAVHSLGSAYTQYSINEAGTHRRMANQTYTKTYSRGVSASYSGSIALDNIPAGTVSSTQYYSGTITQSGTTVYTATPTYSGNAYQRIKSDIDKNIPSRYQKYETLYVHDIQTYDDGVTSVVVDVLNNAKVPFAGMTRTMNSSVNTNGYRKQWAVQPFVLADTMPDTPAGQNYYTRTRSYNASGTLLATSEIPFILRTDFTINDPVISSEVLYIGEDYHIDVAGPRHTNSIWITFPFPTLNSSGTEVAANTGISVPLSVPDVVTGVRTGTYNFQVSPTQNVSGTYDISIEGRSITDNHLSTKTIDDVDVRIMRIVNLEFVSRRINPTTISPVAISGPVASPIAIQADYINNLQIEQRQAKIIELEFYVNNTPINNVLFISPDGDLVRHPGVRTTYDMTEAAYTLGDNRADHKATLILNNPNDNYVDISFVIPRVFRDTNMGSIISIKITAYDEYGYIINTTEGDKFLTIVGSEYRDDRDDPNNIR